MFPILLNNNQFQWIEKWLIDVDYANYDDEEEEEKR